MSKIPKAFLEDVAKLPAPLRDKLMKFIKEYPGMIEIVVGNWRSKKENSDNPEMWKKIVNDELTYLFNDISPR